jgi:Family of unknown function (DUF6282)
VTITRPAPPTPTPRPNDPTQARYLTSYMARRTYAEPVQTPPFVHGVKDAIDIHCHAHEGQQDALAVAKLASQSGMKGILYKTIVNGPNGPAAAVRAVLDELNRWADEQHVTPIQAWAGFCVARGSKPPSFDMARQHLEDGCRGVWMPIAQSANTLHKVGGRPIWWGASTNPYENSEPLPWEEALQKGHYLLDEHGNLKQVIKDIFQLVLDYDAMVFFAHATHPEIYAMAELVQQLGIKKAVIDHPFSPFVDLSLDQMQELTAAGIYMNFTYDEISPLLGVDPARMCSTIKALGTNHVTLSSDAGEPLFPNSVEAIRLIRSHMRAFGLSDQEVHQISCDNPARLVGAA